MSIACQKLNYIDLFAGCGGLSLGLFNSGVWQGLFAVEKNADAFETLKTNLAGSHSHFDWPEWLPKKNLDIRAVLKEHRPFLIKLNGNVDLVAGGPPCQGFSTAGRRREEDERNTLVHSYLEFIELVRPRMILFENVRGFRVGFRKKDKLRGIPYSEVVIGKLQEMGYSDAQAHIVDFSKFGVPQQRKRCIIVGTQAGISSTFFARLEEWGPRFLRSKRLPARQSVESAISDLLRSNGTIPSSDSPGFQEGVYSRRPETAYQTLMRRKRQSHPDSHRFANHSLRTELKFNAIIHLGLTSKQVREIFGTRKCSTKLLAPELPAPTLTTLPDDYVHYCEPRILTVREYARIQSFPDWFTIKGKYTTGGDRRREEVPRYTQLGNAIPPLFAEHAGWVLHEAASEGRRATGKLSQAG